MLHKTNFTKFFFVVTLLFASESIAQDKSMHMHMKETKTEKQSADSIIVRKGIIDLISIDRNIDGKVYQCPMELNVLSDVKGECPECGMNLREVSIADAKTKLLKRGFEIKEQNINETPKSETKNNETAINIWNKVCPVMGEEVDPEAPTEVYNGKTIGFCCPGCDKKFKKDPEKYMKNLSEDGSKYLGK